MLEEELQRIADHLDMSVEVDILRRRRRGALKAGDDEKVKVYEDTIRMLEESFLESVGSEGSDASLKGGSDAD